MRDHDLELIAALVEGRLEDETEARALVASSPEHEREYLSQKMAFDALSTLARPAMTESEKASLHRDVWTELRSQPAATPARSPWYYRWAPVAAGLFVVVGLVAVINQTGSPERVETAAEFSQTTSASDSASGEAGSDGGATAPTSETPSSAEDFVTADFARALKPPEIAFYEDEAEKARDGELLFLENQETDEGARPVLQACIEEAGLDGYTVVGTSATPFEVPEEATSFLAAIPESADLADAPVAFVDLATCELVYYDD